ncbi:MAG: SMP-30/gluconolactonase/LRE family protein [Nisaea sp.]|nr:SMP-30/gluconolactonase/LRE family protein [Nisaea sp.]
MEELVTGFGLIEGPTWLEDKGLLFSDVIQGGVYLLDASNNTSTIVEHRRGIGGIALHEDNGLIVGGRNISYKSFTGDKTITLLSNDVTEAALGFNDLTTDSKGRIYVGSVAFRVFSDEEMIPGHLHVIDIDGSVRTISDGVMLTNGLGFSPDEKILYHADARDAVVRRYEVDSDGGVSAWKPFVKTDKGHPDGLAIAEDGSIWVAMAYGSRVDVFENDGTLRKSLPVPLPMVTSVCFGGSDLKDLYVVTGSRGGPSDSCGTIFKTRVDVPGLPIADSRITLAKN